MKPEQYISVEIIYKPQKIHYKPCNSFLMCLIMIIQGLKF